ncbi:MAG: magnesium transporter [Candidatus Bathyarchaeia archaeon]|nr:magnesium transporter [Candidatus Bathyarchaeota archaeon]
METDNGAINRETSNAREKAGRRFKIFWESIFSLSNTPLGLVAGVIFAMFYTNLVRFRSWSIAIYPTILTTKGVINGILAGRLSTGLHVGLINPSLTKNTRYYYIILNSQLALSLLIGLLTSFIAFLITSTPLEELNIIIFTSLAVQAISLGLINPATAIVAFIAYKRGLDPDIVLYPFSSSIADILSTISYVISLMIAFWLNAAGNIIIHIIGLIAIFLLCIVTYRFRNESEYWKTLRESFLAVVIATLIAMISGFFLLQIEKQLEEAQEILIIYPALIDSLGDVAASFGSITTTRLHLGLVKAKISDIGKQFYDLTQIWCSGLIYYSIYGSIAYLIDRSVKSFFIAIISFILVSPIIILLAYSVAILTFKNGLDPDNFVIPIETSVTDAMLTTCIAILIFLLH